MFIKANSANTGATLRINVNNIEAYHGGFNSNLDKTHVRMIGGGQYKLDHPVEDIDKSILEAFKREKD